MGFLFFTVAGCGWQSLTVPARAIVTLDGKPLAGAAVLFSPIEGGVPARGMTQDDGSVVLSTFKENDGSLVGTHRVAVTKVESVGFTTGSDGLSGKLDGRRIQTHSLIPERYASPATSGLEVRVERRGKNVFDLRLKAAENRP
jgi:hypothetical protein